jgi:hypothetical protein
VFVITATETVTVSIVIPAKIILGATSWTRLVVKEVAFALMLHQYAPTNIPIPKEAADKTIMTIK